MLKVSHKYHVFSLLAGVRVDLWPDQKCLKEVWNMNAGYLHHVLSVCVTPSHKAFCSTACTASFLSNSPLKLWIPSIPDILETAKLMPNLVLLLPVLHRAVGWALCWARPHAPFLPGLPGTPLPQAGSLEHDELSFTLILCGSQHLSSFNHNILSVTLIKTLLFQFFRELWGQSNFTADEESVSTHRENNGRLSELLLMSQSTD